jgi:hypothetical protein
MPGGGTFPQNAGIFNQYTAHKPKRQPPIYQNNLGNLKNFLYVLHTNSWFSV